MQSELKPCPFCGDKPIIEDGANDRPWVVQCINRDCTAQPFMDHADTKRQAITAWNTRASDAEITRLTEALRAAEEREKALVRLVERAQVNTPDQYVSWHEDARQALAGAKP